MSTSLKILLIYDCVYPDSLGGVEHRNYRLAKALADRGHHVTLAGWMELGLAPLPGITLLPMVWRTPLYGPDGKRTIWISLKFALATLTLDLRDYDIVETANIPNAHLFPLALRCWLLKKPFIITWHEYFGTYWQQYKGWFPALFLGVTEWLCAQLGTCVSAVSTLTADRLQKYRRRSDEIRLIPNGVNTEQIQQAAANPDPAATPLLYAGRLVPEKRVDLLLRAIGLMSWSKPEPLLTIVGDGPARPQLENLTQQLGLSNKVKFVGRLPFSNQMWRLLAGARIAAQPSAREGFGMFPLEAMALGIPVVYCSSPDNAIGTIVRDGQEGICTEASPEALAKGLENLLQTDDLWLQLSNNAKSRAIFYDWSTVAKDIERLCHDAIAATHS